ncbi:MAG: PIG-L family deacetylase [Pseudomonadales bacterium]|nr:PIG-L family deacetylase [Candidatus Woesebacteria bacterium]MCB9802372.1 PIG-L family deacetylase [Pseudomonadales bacterium]
MKYLFIFAHPDDESVACAGTIKQLVDAGDTVALCMTTDAAAGEIHRDKLSKEERAFLPTEIRTKELHAACMHLGVSDCVQLGYPDGGISNNDVWGRLTSDIIGVIDTITPDVLVTFDHDGWYYHLDHVGTSLATTKACHQAEHQVGMLLFACFRPSPEVGKQKWQYAFDGHDASTHRVLVADTRHKLQALDLHASQNLAIPKQMVKEITPHYEYYRVGFMKDGFSPGRLFEKMA